MAHVAYWRSPVAHMRIRKIHADAARAVPGVLLVADGHDLAKVCKPWVAMLGHLAGMKSAPQYALAVDRACWQGEPVVAVVARDARPGRRRAGARLQVDWDELPAVTDMETALDPATPLIHPELGDNLCFTRSLDVGGVDEALRRADAVAEATFDFGRHTGVTLEPRVPDRPLEPGRAAPHRVPLVPGPAHDAGPVRRASSTCRPAPSAWSARTWAAPSASRCTPTPTTSPPWRCPSCCGRPVKFVADRLESFASDIHARHHRIKGRIAVNKGGEILAFEIDDLTGIGPYSVFPRTSAIEGNQVVNLVGGPVQAQGLPRQAEGGVPEQDADLPVPRRGPPDRLRGDRGAGGPGGAEDRHGPAGTPPAQRDPRRRLPDHRRLRHQAGDPLARGLPAQAARADELRRPARRAGGAAQAGRPSRHRLGHADRAHQPQRRVLRRGRRAHRIAGRRHRAARPRGRHHGDGGRGRTGPGHRGHLRPDRGRRGGRGHPQGAHRHRRHRRHALRRRHLGFARRGHRRRGGAAGRPGAAREHPQGGGRHPQARGRHAGGATRRASSMPPARRSCCPCTNSAASPTSAPTRCRRPSRPS